MFTIELNWIVCTWSFLFVSSKPLMRHDSWYVLWHIVVSTWHARLSHVLHRHHMSTSLWGKYKLVTCKVTTSWTSYNKIFAMHSMFDVTIRFWYTKHACETLLCLHCHIPIYLRWTLIKHLSYSIFTHHVTEKMDDFFYDTTLLVSTQKCIISSRTTTQLHVVC